jgi:hypothetical protein
LAGESVRLRKCQNSRDVRHTECHLENATRIFENGKTVRSVSKPKITKAKPRISEDKKPSIVTGVDGSRRLYDRGRFYEITDES